MNKKEILDKSTFLLSEYKSCLNAGLIETKDKQKKISLDKVVTTLMISKNKRILKKDTIILGYKIADKIILL